MTQSTPDFEDTNVAVPDDELELEVNDDANLDVDVPADDEADTISEPTADGTPAKPVKATRPKAPEGYVKPVEFAKLLSEHLGKTVPPQVVYSYIKNNSGETSKNPFPTHEVDGYEWYIKPAEGLEWWDAKNARVSAGKAARAEKAAKKSASSAAGTDEGTSESVAVVEAE
jgi:hypothetical protein